MTFFSQPPGVTSLGAIDNQVADLPIDQKVLKASRLSELDPYCFFTVGVVASVLTPDIFDIMSEFQKTPEGQEKPIVVTFPSTLFYGLSQYETIDYSRLLLAYTPETFKQFKKFAGTVSLLFRETNFYGRVRWYDTKIPDPLLSRTASILLPEHMHKITVFGLDTNYGKYYLAPENETGRIVFSYDDIPYEDTLAMADKLLVHHSSPLEE